MIKFWLSKAIAETIAGLIGMGSGLIIFIVVNSVINKHKGNDDE